LRLGFATKDLRFYVWRFGIWHVRFDLGFAHHWRTPAGLPAMNYGCSLVPTATRCCTCFTIAAMPASLSVVQSKPVSSVFIVHYEKLLKFENYSCLKSITVPCVVLYNTLLLTDSNSSILRSRNWQLIGMS